MKKGRNILKFVSLTSSATLMVGFVAFKSGAFTNYVGASTYSPPDSLKKDSLTQKENTDFIHSSKMLIIDWDETLSTSVTDTTEKDSTFIIPSSKNDVMFDVNDIPIMSGSKSGIIFEAADSDLIKPADTTQKDLKTTKENPDRKFRNQK